MSERIHAINAVNISGSAHSGRSSRGDASVLWHLGRADHVHAGPPKTSNNDGADRTLRTSTHDIRSSTHQQVGLYAGLASARKTRSGPSETGEMFGGRFDAAHEWRADILTATADAAIASPDRVRRLSRRLWNRWQAVNPKKKEAGCPIVDVANPVHQREEAAVPGGHPRRRDWDDGREYRNEPIALRVQDTAPPTTRPRHGRCSLRRIPLRRHPRQ